MTTIINVLMQYVSILFRAIVISYYIKWFGPIVGISPHSYKQIVVSLWLFETFISNFLYLFTMPGKQVFINKLFESEEVEKLFFTREVVEKYFVSIVSLGEIILVPINLLIGWFVCQIVNSVF